MEILLFDVVIAVCFMAMKLMEEKRTEESVDKLVEALKEMKTNEQ